MFSKCYWKQKGGLQKKHFSGAMVCNFQYSCFHHLSADQLTASADSGRRKAVANSSGDRSLLPVDFAASHMKGKGLIETTYSVNISLTPYPYCEFN